MQIEQSMDNTKYIIFTLGESLYAIQAELTKEIVTNLPCFEIPFSPNWVRGVLNRHGEPYIILDIQTLLGGEKVEAKNYILLNIKNDNIAILINTINELQKVQDNQIHPITSLDVNEDYYLGAIKINDNEVFVLNIAKVLKKLAYDIQNA